MAQTPRRPSGTRCGTIRPSAIQAPTSPTSPPSVTQPHLVGYPSPGGAVHRWAATQMHAIGPVERRLRGRRPTVAFPTGPSCFSVRSPMVGSRGARLPCERQRQRAQRERMGGGVSVGVQSAVARAHVRARCDAQIRVRYERRRGRVPRPARASPF